MLVAAFSGRDLSTTAEGYHRGRERESGITLDIYSHVLPQVDADTPRSLFTSLDPAIEYEQSRGEGE
jgi:hypothetical protein